MVRRARSSAGAFRATTGVFLTATGFCWRTGGFLFAVRVVFAARTVALAATGRRRAAAAGFRRTMTADFFRGLAERAAEVVRSERFAVVFFFAPAAAVRRPAADFFFATRFGPAEEALPERATVRFRLLVRAPFRFAITRSFRNASEPRLTLTVPGK
jgi:hypothetical protein